MSLSQGDACLSCPGPVDLGVQLPHLAGVTDEEVTAAAGLLLVTARARAPEAACPRCGAVSRRVHSRYARTLADAAIGGRQTVILLAVRRFFCRVGFQNSATAPDLALYAARSYSLIRPPRTGRRLIRSLEKSATG